MREQRKIAVAVIGAGNMGGAVIKGLCEKKILPAGVILACDQDAAKLAALEGGLGVAVESSPAVSARQAQTVILAVKPAQSIEVLRSISPELPADAVLISLVGGLSLASIEKLVECRTARVMPNLPCAIGRGITGIYSSYAEARAEAQRLFSAVGETVVLEQEDQLDGVTGISGSGPGFVAYMMEAMLEGAARVGINPQDARALVIETFAGTAELLLQTSENPESLRERVSTPRGTTRAGIAQFDAKGVKEAIASGVEAAARRAREISAELSA